MFNQVGDFRDKSLALDELLTSMEGDFLQATLFKGWNVNNILRHLHVWNWAATVALTEPAKFQEFISDAFPFVRKEKLHDFERERLNGICGQELLDAWRQGVIDLCAHYGSADPEHCRFGSQHIRLII